ncbi:MAG: ferredoxin [Chloroflexi bacterium]|nr:ferredoxin [Chloroflexota bacterium]
MRVWVDRETCIGAGTCTIIAPDVFDLDEENKAVIIDPHGASEATIREAADACPVQAIMFEVFEYED